MLRIRERDLRNILWDVIERAGLATRVRFVRYEKGSNGMTERLIYECRECEQSWKEPIDAPPSDHMCKGQAS